MSGLVWLSATQMRRKGPFRSSRPNRKVRLLADIRTGFPHYLVH